MKKAIREPSTTTIRPQIRAIKPEELRTVTGGALNAYFESVVGEKQGK